MVIVRNNLKRMFKSKLNWIFFIILPLTLMYMMVNMQLASNTYNIAVVDYDKTEFTQKLIDRISEVGNIISVEESNIREDLLDSKYDYALVIPSGITETIEKGGNAQVEGYAIMESNVSVPVQYMLRSYLSATSIIGSKSADNTEFLKILEQYEEGKVVCEVKDISDKEVKVKSNFVTSLGISVMCMMLMLTFSTTLIIKDKESGMYDRIMSGQYSKAAYNAQHIISYFLIAIVQSTFMIFMAVSLSNIEIGVYLIKIALLFIVFSLSAVALGIMVSNFTKSTKQANAIISILTIPMSMLGGCLWDRNMMPEVMQNIANIVPTTWVMKGIDATVSNLGNYTQCIIVLLIFVLVFFVLGLVKSERR